MLDCLCVMIKNYLKWQKIGLVVDIIVLVGCVMYSGGMLLEMCYVVCWVSNYNVDEMLL